MTFWPANLGWQPQWDNPDFRGWSVVAAYVVAAAFCARTALAGRKMEAEEVRESVLWRVLALGLLFLGINKQLNLQTLLIVLCRRAMLFAGWEKEGRTAQLVFSAVFIVTGVALIGLLRVRFRLFFARNRWVFAGVFVLLVFVLIRAASIGHVLKWLGLERSDGEGVKIWTWILEIGGSACLAFAAIKAGRESSRGQP